MFCPRGAWVRVTQAEYLGEDGEWYFWFTGSDGQMFNLTHVFYATAYDAVNIATIQRVSGTDRTTITRVDAAE